MIYTVLNTVAARVRTVTGIEPITVFEPTWETLPEHYGWVEPTNLPEAMLGALIATGETQSRASAGQLRISVQMRFHAVSAQDKAELICNAVDHTRDDSVQHALLTTTYANQIKLLFTQWIQDHSMPDYMAVAVTAQAHLDTLLDV